MISRAVPPTPSAFRRWQRQVFRFPLEIVRVGLESAVTRRGLVLAFFIVAAMFTMVGWLRPPLSPDVRAHHIPLNLSGDRPADPQLILSLPRHARLDSPGGVLLVFIVLGGGLAMLWPRRVATVAGILLALSIVANAILCFNYPALVELMDSEVEQRQMMARVLVAQNADSLANGGEPRIIASPDTAPWLRGYDYLLYGPWLVIWSALPVLLAAHGPVRCRLGWIGLSALCGVACSVIVCLPRLRAEFYWTQAVRHEARSDWDQARRSLDTATALDPELQVLRHIRLFRGKLDYREQQQSLDQQLWRVEQWRRNNEHAKAVAMMDSMSAAASGDLSVARFAAQLYSRVGLSYCDEGRWTAASEMWRRATMLDPQRWDSHFFLGTFQARMDRDQPDLVDAQYLPILGRLADRVLRADILANLGDAYFDAGQMQIARQHYEASLRAFELPKDINYRARKGLVGM